MTGSYDFYKAAFKQAGIIELREIHETVDFLKSIEAKKFPNGRGVAVMGVSGGSAIVFADVADREGLRLCELSKATQGKLGSVVPSIGAIQNPVDLTAGYFSSSNKEKLQIALQAVIEDENVDSICLNLATTGKAGCLAVGEVLSQMAGSFTKPIILFSSTPVSETGNALEIFASAQIPVLPSPGRAAKAIAMMVKYRESQMRNKSTSASQIKSKSAAEQFQPRKRELSGVLSEADSKALLAGIGISVTKDLVVKGLGDEGLKSLKPPFVVKIVSPDIPHKTEVGGVKLGIRTNQELGLAIDDVMQNAKRHVPNARISGVMVSEMVSGGFELIAGVVNDPVFGPVVMVGAGGIYAEVMKDTSCRIAPFDEETGREMVDELNCRPILSGARGGPVLDAGAVAKALAALSNFAWDERENLAEIDINPLFALPRGAVAADALVIGRNVHFQT